MPHTVPVRFQEFYPGFKTSVDDSMCASLPDASPGAVQRRGHSAGAVYTVASYDVVAPKWADLTSRAYFASTPRGLVILLTGVHAALRRASSSSGTSTASRF